MPHGDTFETKYGLPKSAKRNALKGIKTVNDLLARDDVNGIIEHLDKTKPHIQDCIVIYVDKRDNRIHWNNTEETLTSLAVYMLEIVKSHFLTPDDEDE